MATPLTSGVVAVHLSKQPMISPSDMKQKLINESLSGVLSFEGVPPLYRSSTANKLLNVQGSCGGDNFLRSFTPLRSPGYPLSYPPHLDCVWHLKVDQGEQVVVNISTVRLEANYDVLQLYEGECCDNLVSQFTGDLGVVGYTYTSVSGEVSLRLLTDGSVSVAGFTGSLTRIYAGTDIKVPDPDIEIPTVAVVSKPVHVITLRSLSPKRARSEVTAHLTNGYKVTWITTHSGGAIQSHAMDVILSNSTLVDTRVFIDLTATQLNETIHQMANEGYSIKTLADRERGRAPGSSISYTALFERTNYLLETEVFLGDSLEQWRNRVAVMNSSGYRLISQSFVDYQGKQQAATVFTRDRRLAHNITFEPPPKMAVINNATFFDFTGLVLDYARRNYYLSHIEVHQRASNPSAMFSAIMLEHTDETIHGGHWFRWGLSEEAVKAIIQVETADWDPYITTGYSHQGAIVYYIAFVRHSKR